MVKEWKRLAYHEGAYGYWIPAYPQTIAAGKSVSFAHTYYGLIKFLLVETRGIKVAAGSAGRSLKLRIWFDDDNVDVYIPAKDPEGEYAACVNFGRKYLLGEHTLKLENLGDVTISNVEFAAYHAYEEIAEEVS